MSESRSRLFVMSDIAAAVGRAYSTAQTRARIERWTYRMPRPTARGGRPTRYYRARDLPGDVRSALEDLPSSEIPDGVRSALERQPVVSNPLPCSTPACIRPADASGICEACRKREQRGSPLDGPPAVRHDRPDRRMVELGARRLREAGVSQSVWADWHGFSADIVSRVVRGRLVGTCGEARRIVLALCGIGRTGRIPDRERMRAETARRLEFTRGRLSPGDRRIRDRRICAMRTAGVAYTVIARRERLSVERVRQIFRQGPPEPDPHPDDEAGACPDADAPRKTVRIPEGHPSRYRVLKPSRIPAWARGL